MRFLAIYFEFLIVIHLFLFIGDLRFTTSNLVRSFASNTALYYSLTYRTLFHANTTISHNRCVARVSLNFDLEHIAFGDSNNDVTFNISLLISFKCYPLSPHLSFDSSMLSSIDCFPSWLSRWCLNIVIIIHI